MKETLLEKQEVIFTKTQLIEMFDKMLAAGRISQDEWIRLRNAFAPDGVRLRETDGTNILQVEF